MEAEKELDIATALSGSGPAYLALVAEALCDGAVREGLKREDAMTLMRGLFKGFGELIQTIHPALLKDNVMSPGGTTAAGYGALENIWCTRGMHGGNTSGSWTCQRDEVKSYSSFFASDT